MEENTSAKKTFSIKVFAWSVLVDDILGVLLWLLLLLCKDWLLSVLSERFYAYILFFSICAAGPVVDSIRLLYRAKRKSISISRGIMVDIWTILAINTFSLLFALISLYVIAATSGSMSNYDYCQRLCGFYFRYGFIYAAAMLISALFGIAAIRRTKKGEGKVLDSEK